MKIVLVCLLLMPPAAASLFGGILNIDEKKFYKIYDSDRCEVAFTAEKDAGHTSEPFGFAKTEFLSWDTQTLTHHLRNTFRVKDEGLVGVVTIRPLSKVNDSDAQIAEELLRQSGQRISSQWIFFTIIRAGPEHHSCFRNTTSISAEGFQSI